MTTATAIPDQYSILAELDSPCFVLPGPTLTTTRPSAAATVLAELAPLPAHRLGSPAFRARHGVRFAYQAGAMAGGIASVELVAALAKAGHLASFGAAGLRAEVIDAALLRLTRDIPGLPFACNLIASPSEPAMERGAVEVFLRHRVRCVEASAYVDLTPSIVRYRVAGLTRDRSGRVVPTNRVIAKLSRPEVAARFLAPPPPALVADLLAERLITPEQAELAAAAPMADDITAEADSGGHTDRRPLPVLLPALMAQRDAAAGRYASRIGVGAAGGLGTPAAIAGAFAMGADYVVTGSVNQTCVEAGTSPAVRRLLAQAGIADFQMAPAADMFELGVEIQVLRRGTMFPMRAAKLHELYREYAGIEHLPAHELARLEREIFCQPVEAIWRNVVDYFAQRDPSQLERAGKDPKRRMAMLFRWYLGMASRWATAGDRERRLDYQVWCGPAVGSFNEWARGTDLENPENRRVADVAERLMTGAAIVTRIAQLRLAGGEFPTASG